MHARTPRRATYRLALTAFAGAQTLALAACCSGGWNLTEPGEAALMKARPSTQAVFVDYDACELPDTMVRALERAAIILGDEEAALIDYQARIDRALTDGEREALVAKREELLDGMISQVDQLKAVSAQAGGTSSIAVVYTATKVSSMSEHLPVLTAEFDYLTALSPGVMPAGIVIKDVNPRLALSTLVDDMERFALEKQVLTAETRARLADQ